MSVKRVGCKPILRMPTYSKLICENITVIRPVMLKVYYWESFEIEKFNEKLAGINQQFIEHTFKFPVRLLNSQQLKVIFWIRNISTNKLEMSVKRIKRCNCVVKQTKVGFNQYTELYHCPHRRLVTVAQEIIKLNENELFSLSVTSSYFLYGEHELSFDLCCSDNRVIRLNFFLNITHIVPNQFVLTNSLIPQDIREYRRTTQVIWVNNLSVMNIQLRFKAKTRGFSIINPTIDLSKHNILPLLVRYRPSCENEQIQLHVAYKKLTETISISGKAITQSTLEEVETIVPEDISCDSNPYIIFPNKVEIELDVKQERSRMVILHNDDQNCMEFYWEPYIMPGLFEITFAPESFRLKGHHIKLVAVFIKTFNKSVHFKRTPLILNVHRIMDHNTRIAKVLTTEFDISIDDPKTLRNTYVQHLFLEMSIKVNTKPPVIEPIEWDASDTKYEKPLEYPTKVTLLEKFFGQKLAEGNFMRPHTKNNLPTNLSFNDLLQYAECPAELPKPPKEMDKWTLIRIMSELLYEAVEDLSKFWFYVPLVYATDEINDEDIV